MVAIAMCRYRAAELSKLRKQELFTAANRFAFFAIPILTALCTFTSYPLPFLPLLL